MKKYTIFEVTTGRIVSTNECSNAQLPPEGPLPDNPELAVIWGNAIPGEERAEHGRIVPLGIQDRLRKEKARGWFEVRKKRQRMLAETDFKMTGDYPLTAAEKRKLKSQRQKSRDITKATKDPREALRLLDEIWAAEAPQKGTEE